MTDDISQKDARELTEEQWQRVLTGIDAYSARRAERMKAESEANIEHLFGKPNTNDGEQK